MGPSRVHGLSAGPTKANGPMETHGPLHGPPKVYGPRGQCSIPPVPLSAPLSSSQAATYNLALFDFKALILL